MRGARGSSCARKSAAWCAATSASAGLTRRAATLEHARVAHGGEHQVLVADVARVPSRSMASSTLSRLCAGSPMPMNTTFFTGRMRAGQGHLGHDLGAATWRSRPPARSCRTRSPRRSPPGWTRTRHRAAAARSPPSGRRPAPPAGVPSRRRRGADFSRASDFLQLGGQRRQGARAASAA
jgi:hypothetical protein